MDVWIEIKSKLIATNIRTHSGDHTEHGCALFDGEGDVVANLPLAIAEKMEETTSGTFYEDEAISLWT